MSFTDKKTLSVAEAVKTVLSKKVDPNDPNDPRNFRASDPKMLDKINTALKNSQAVKIAYDVADSFGKSPEPSEKPKSIPYMPDYKRVSNREISGPITRKKQDVNEAQTQSGTVMRNASNVLRAAQNPSQDKPSTEKQRLGMKYYEKKSYPNSTSSSSQPKPLAKPNQDKVDAANRVQSGQRAAVLPSPSAKDSEDSQSAKKDVISNAMRKQQDMERLNQLADKDTDNNTSTDKDTTAPDDDINKAVKQAKEPKQDFEQDVKEIDVTDKNKSKKTNEEKQMTTFRDAAIKALYETKKKADKDYDKDGKIESPKDEVWGSRLRAAKMAGKLKEEEQIDEAFPTVADGEKSLKAKEGKTTHGKITKTKTGMKHERDYDDQPEPEVKRGRGRPKKRLSEMRQEYFNYFEEEVDNETFTKELKDQKAKFDGKKKGADVAKASVQAVKQEEVEQIDEISKETAGKYLTAPQGKGANKYKVSSDKSVYPNIETMTKHSTNVRRALKRSEGSSLYKKPDYYKEEVEQIDELSKKTLGSYIKKANARQTDDYHDAGSMDVEPERRDGIARTEKINRAVDKLVSKKTNEEVEQIDEVSPPGREDQVKALKKVPGIDNPWAVAWASYRKSHPKKD